MAQQVRQKVDRIGPEAAAKELLKRQIGARLKEARFALRYQTAEDIAADIEENGQTYRRYERGDSFVPPDVMVRLGTLGVSLNYLMLGIEPKLLRR